ncbi:hypothetical protein [Furfurilactobacillus cerevisiae]
MNFNDDTKVIQINQLNGRQGDTRTARIKTVQDNQAGTGIVAYSIDGLQPQIVGKDAKGNTIQIAGNWNPINVNLGLFSITAPANVYQAVGLTQGCYLRLVDGSGNVISSIPVIFEVIQDSSSMTNYEAAAFLQGVDSVAQQGIEKFDSANTLAQTAKDVANQALVAAKQADTDAKAQNVVKNNGDQVVIAPDFNTPDGGKLSDWNNFNKARKLTFYGQSDILLSGNAVFDNDNTPEIISLETDQYADTSVSVEIYFTQALKADAIMQIFTVPQNLLIDSFSAGNGVYSEFINGIGCHVFARNHTFYIYPYSDVPMTDSIGTNRLMINFRTIWKK